MGDQSKNTGHAADIKNQMRLMTIVLGIGTVFGIALGELLGSWAWLLFGGCVMGWITLGGYWLLNRGIIEPIGDAIGRVLVPAGGSTPSVAQHSNIEAMEAQGRYAEAAAAYQQVIASSPEDQIAPDKLGQLAMRQLKDYPLAITAYREAERRAADSRRKVGYAMMIADIYRDNVKDYGKTMVELRRIVSTYPDVPNRSRLSAEIDELKAMHFEKS